MNKRNKYNIGISKKSKAERTVDGHLFMSKRESERYKVLKDLENKGDIKDLQIQPKFILQLSFTDAMGEKHREIAYIADFRYYDTKTKKDIVEDTKGYRTDIYKLKKKLFLYSYQDVVFKES
jgi:hypothetical protein